MLIRKYALKTERENFYNVTAKAREAVRESGVRDGLCVVFCPHTTAGVTLNENADPDVVHDMLLGLRAAFPDRREFRHAEGNSSAHLRASCVGSSVTVVVSEGQLVLGRWQAIWFCEFDGPRSREFHVSVL